MYGAVELYATKDERSDWEVQVNGLLENCNEIAVPQELTYKGQFLSFLIVLHRSSTSTEF